MLRATLKGMLSRKARLILSTLSVVLGVMFVSGAFVLTDTLGRSFDAIFTVAYSDTDIAVDKPAKAAGLDGQATGTIPVSAVATVQKVPGVTQVTPQVLVDGAKVIGKDGKIVLSNAGRLGGNWTGETSLVKLRDGRPPQADNEIMLGAGVAKTTGYTIGDTVPVETVLDPTKRDYTVVGIFGYSGGRDSLAGESTVLFTLPVAQQLMLGQPDVFSSLGVTVTPGADKNAVRDAVASALGPDYKVQTGEQAAAESANSIKDGLKFVTYILLGFAAIALFVGIFLILNTFLIIVAQRTKELALLRAMGASRGQVIGSVITEAAVVGLLASVVGLALGIGIGALLGSLLGSVITQGALPGAGVGVPASAVISAFAVGMGVTIIAALLPAIRGSLVPPVAAMRESAAAESTKLVRGLTIAGVVLLVAGGGTLWAGLAGKLGSAGLLGTLSSVLVLFVAVTLLTPVISRPVVAAIGAVMSLGAAGKLGRRNSARNPVRTAITAGALMVGIALVTAISLIFSSIKASTIDAIDAGVNAEIIIAADQGAGGLPSIDPAYLSRLRALPDVQSAVGIYVDQAELDGDGITVDAVDDVPGAISTFRLTPVTGTMTITSGQAIIDDHLAADRGWGPGTTLDLAFARGEKTITIIGVYSFTTINNGLFITATDAEQVFRSPTPVQGYVTVKPGANVDTALAEVNKVLADSPEVSAQKTSDWIATQAQAFNTILGFIQVLLLMAMIIAVLGVVNTLALSMTERTRELGLLRAVGMQRGQMMRMVTVESVVICVFGALLGIGVGVGLGLAVFQALRDQGLHTIAYPWQLMVVYLVLSVIVGLGAALVPAIRAARLDVLKAIAYE